MAGSDYLMESEAEAIRLERKTDRKRLEKQALWAGIRPGMRVLDAGCGSGKTSFFLHRLVQPGGEVVGVDASHKRLEYAREHFGGERISYACKDFYRSMADLGEFDFIWVRFVLEYHRAGSFGIVEKLTEILKPGGILCLIDLDCNCLSHYGLSERLEKTIASVIARVEEKADFDPYMGRKLYSFLYDLGFEKIKLDLAAHHLIAGELSETDAYNWFKKIEVAARRSEYPFEEYPGGFEEFQEEFKRFFQDPRRFTYTPLIACRGEKPGVKPSPPRARRRSRNED